MTATLRPIDNEMAAEQTTEEARRLQARAEALYRRSVDSAAVEVCRRLPMNQAYLAGAGLAVPIPRSCSTA